MYKCALPVALIASSAAAEIIVVDEFAAGPFSQTLDAGVVIDQQDIGVLGGQRDYAASVGANPFASDLTVSVNPDVGLTYAAGPGVSGFLALQYDGDEDVEGDDIPLNPDGGLTLDVSGLTSLDLEFLFLDIPMGVTVELANVEDGDISAASALEQIVDDFEGSNVVSFDLDDFTGDADLTQVNAVTITFNSQKNAPAARDFVVRDITFVPAPGTLALLGIGALAIRRRR